MQNFWALGAPPPDLRAYGGLGLFPQTPSLRQQGASPQDPHCLRRLGAPPPHPLSSPPLRISGYAPAHLRRQKVGCSRVLEPAKNRSSITTHRLSIVATWRKRSTLVVGLTPATLLTQSRTLVDYRPFHSRRLCWTLAVVGWRKIFSLTPFQNFFFFFVTL